MFQLTLPDERRAQDFMVIDHRLPGLTEPLGVEAADVQAHLVEVMTRALLVQRVEQHALLHGRQAIDIFDLAGGDGQGIQLRLGQTGQTEIRWRDGSIPGVQTMRHQYRQLLHQFIGQALDGRHLEHLLTERPTQAQLTGKHLATQAEPVVQRRFQALLRTGVLLGRLEQGLARIIETGIELPQVVERNARFGQSRQQVLGLGIAQVAQDTEADPLVGDRSQLFLDLFDGPGQVLQRREPYREGTGEPTDAARQIHVLEHLFATVSFQPDQGIGPSAPAPDHPGQGRQQQVIDLGPIGRRGLLEQLPGQIGVQAGLHGPGVLVLQPALRAFARQVRSGPFQRLLPIAQFLLQGLATRIAAQTLGPGLERRSLGRQLHGLPCLQPGIGRLQVIEQDTPGNAIDRQVVDHQQQALATIGHGPQHRPQQRTVLQIQAGLGLLPKGLQRSFVSHLPLPEQRCLRPFAGQLLRSTVTGAPLALVLMKHQAQGIMVNEQGPQRLLKPLGL